MEANEKTFRHSFGKLAFMFLGVLILGFLTFSVNQTETDYFLLVLTGIAFVIALFYATSSVKVSNEEITTTRFLISKSLRWSEIASVSMRGQMLRLHNRDEDLALSIDSQLEGYREILDNIFDKRSDLFDDRQNAVMASSWLLNIFIAGLSLVFLAISVFLFFAFEGFERIFALIFFVLGLFMILFWLLSPKRLTLESKKLVLGYLFKETSYSAEDIHSISLEKQSTRNGYVYFVRMNLKSGKKVNLPTFNQGVPLTYQFLKRWHQRATSTS